MSNLWLAIEPMASCTKLMLSRPSQGALLKAKLPLQPSQPNGLGLLLEGLVAWCGEPLCAVIDVAAMEGGPQSERWVDFLAATNSPLVTVQFSCAPVKRARRDGFLDTMGDFRSARRLLTFNGTGQR
jgi:hypothetical protein